MNAFFTAGRRRQLLIMLLDCLIVLCACGLSFLLRFDFKVSEFAVWLPELMHFALVLLPVTLVVFWLRRMYHYVWRAITAYDMMSMTLSSAAAYLLGCLISLAVGIALPLSLYFITPMLAVPMQVGMRSTLRFWTMLTRKRGQDDEERILLIGAGEGGRAILNEKATSGRIPGRICCIVDDNAEKWGKYLDGVLIYGGREQIPEAVEEFRITQIIFAIPTCSGKNKQEILNICKKTPCEIRLVPGIYDIVTGGVQVSDIKEIELEDLLGREPVRLNMELMDNFLKDKVVMVTGGGGSIGSELCRQIAKFEPARLVVIDSYENNAYGLQQELIRTYGGRLDLKVEIASIRDKQRTYGVVEKYHPDVIFHAAAHKHVPLMEACPSEAIKNNVFGTYHVVRAAEKFGVKKFVMISTDKAVNPTNFMGATKRFCEMILQSRQKSGTEFCAVRFGNVLGSNGSVVPLFKKQIANGGPITLTDKRIIRYFMTIPEAAQLVLEAGAMAKHNQVFVLDMGEPVRILDLAENLIRLSGLVPYEDIQIVEIGLRPGEKLYEELLIDNDNLQKTANSKIFVEEQSPISPEQLMEHLLVLDRAVTEENSDEDIIELMKSLVPTYRTPGEVNAVVGTNA